MVSALVLMRLLDSCRLKEKRKLRLLMRIRRMRMWIWMIVDSDDE